MDKIQPCPFCNSTSMAVMQDSKFDWWTVRCLVCDARGPETNTESRAIEQWNKAHPPKSSNT